MNLSELLENIGEPESLAFVQENWDEAMNSFPAATPVFLRKDEISSCAAYCGLAADETEFLIGTAEKVAASPELSRLAWYLYWKMYLGTTSLSPVNSKKLPSLKTSLGDSAGAFYLLVLLGIVPFLKTYHRALGVPESATVETMLEVKSLMGNYKNSEGGIGICRLQLYWPQYYLRGNIFFRVGRFEFWIRTYAKSIVNVYRNRKTRKVVALFSEPAFFDKDGLRCIPDERKASENYWPSEFKVEDNCVAGTPASPNGHALRKTVRLPLDEWECVLDKNSVILDMHIPAGGSMTPEACAESFTRARDFYREHFPQLNPSAIVCHSWIFSPDLPEFLPGDSNLVKFMNEVYLYPIESPALAGLWFFFYQEKFDPATAPRSSSLQRAALAHIEKGGKVRIGGMFMLLDDVGEFGTRYYRRNFPEL